MSATVLGCGHTSHLRLFNIDVVITSPHVHLHFWTDENEYRELGYGKVELCCHGCGASTLVYYLEEDDSQRHLTLRNEFTRKHERCPNRNYQSECPDWRSSFKLVDIRQAKRSTRRLEEPAKPTNRQKGTHENLRSLKVRRRVARQEGDGES